MKQLLQIGIRLSAFIIIAGCLYLVSVRTMAQRHYEKASKQNLLEAISWNPRNPKFHSALGRITTLSVDEVYPEEIIRYFETAVKLGPHDARAWVKLANAYEWGNKPTDALHAFETAHSLFPHSPYINWHLGNYLLRENRFVEALPIFRNALIGDITLANQMFSLLLRATDNPSVILREVIPTDHAALFLFLNFLTRNNRLDDTREVWTKIMEIDSAFEPKLAFFYFASLLKDRRLDELATNWNDLALRSPRIQSKDPSQGEYITNGSFENPMVNGGLDWWVQSTEGSRIFIDPFVAYDGAYSLKIRFNGQHNLQFGHVYQFVLVEPNTTLIFSGYMRTENITTNNGPRFEIYDPDQRTKTLISTKNMLGTTRWTRHEVLVDIGSDTRLLVIRVARPPSRKLDNKISGIVWVDSLYLRLVSKFER